VFKIIKEKESQITIKRSKFLGFAFYVDNKSQVSDILESFEGKYKGAAHTVYAYRLSEEGVPKEKFDNDKEPVGSAGQPILYLLQKRDIMNCLIVVIRYFGGTLLGTGGLVRAYTAAAQEALEDNVKEVNV
jgi:uncharacterized YigZ family protein